MREFVTIVNLRQSKIALTLEKNIYNKTGLEAVLDVRKHDCLYQAVQHIAIIYTYKFRSCFPPSDPDTRICSRWWSPGQLCTCLHVDRAEHRSMDPLQIYSAVVLVISLHFAKFLLILCLCGSGFIEFKKSSTPTHSLLTRALQTITLSMLTVQYNNCSL